MQFGDQLRLQSTWLRTYHVHKDPTLAFFKLIESDSHKAVDHCQLMIIFKRIKVSDFHRTQNSQQVMIHWAGRKLGVGIHKFTNRK